MTLSKLAKLANVSVSVVSKAFSGRGDVSEEMREHVFSVAREHGCFQQFYHAPYDKPVVAVIIPEIISQYYIGYLESLKKGLEENGYTILISISNFDAQMVDTLVKYYTEHTKADALITFGAAGKLPEKSKTVVVRFSIESSDDSYSVNRVLRDGLRQTLTKLKGLGHTRIGFVGEPFTTTQQDIFSEECKNLGIDLNECFVYCSTLRFENAGIDGAKKIIALEKKPTAVLCAYGYITLGLLDELENKGIKVPDDISVISMDDTPYKDIHNRHIAHIPALIEECCQEAVKMLNERVRSAVAIAPASACLPTELHQEKSISVPKGE